jgi:hypothetical protein
MKNIEQFISPLIESQFPALYQEEGPLFILFVKEYFKWMEEAGNTTTQSRSLFTYRDIDQTVDEYLIHFKEKYLKGVDFNTVVSKRKLVKAALDLFRSKGTDRSIDLLFKLAYGTKVEIYTPGDDILKPSDGTWVVPRYLEVTRSAKTVGMVGKQITGSKSGATAFVEYVITRNVFDKIIDVMFLSNLVGDFVTDDIITTDSIIDGAPKVTGSLNTLELTLSGQGFEVGEIVNIVSARGVEGKARVTSTIEETGLVSFAIINGGWGYSTDAVTDVSTKVLTLTNITNANTLQTGFIKYETVTQNLYSVSVNNAIGTFRVGDLLSDEAGETAVVVRVNQATGANSANLVINPISGDILNSNNILISANQSFIATSNGVVFNVGDVLRQRTGSTNNAVGTINSVSTGTILTIDTISSSNGLNVGTYVEQPASSAKGILKLIPREFGNDFSNVNIIALVNVTGTFNNTDVINVYTDLSKTTYLANATPNNAITGYVYELISTSGTARWSTGNTVLLSSNPLTNTTISIASDVGGYYYNNVSVTATGSIIGQNTTAVGLISISNNFYSSNNSLIIGSVSNTYANVASVSTGQGADFNIGLIENTETVLLSPDKVSANNDGPGTANVIFSDILISGANSGYGNNGITFVNVFDGGTGYDNTNIATFTGGNTGVGSFTAGNASITTDSSGVITTVTLSANVGNGFITTPTISIVNSTGGSGGVGTGANVEPLFSYGFVKQPIGDASFFILDLLRFESRTIGTITALSGINPGENYNVKPFINTFDEYVAPYGKTDYIITVDNITGSSPTFTTGELVYQVINTSSIQITSNNYSGNTSSSYEVGEQVVFYNGASPSATGIIFSSSIDVGSGNYVTVITDTSGTIANGYFMIGSTSLSNTSVLDQEVVTSSSLAKGRVREVVANTTVYLNRESLFAEFTAGGVAVGSTTGVTADIISVTPDISRRVAGDNADISSNVITSAGAISTLKVVDSGFGYEQDETVNIVSEDGTNIATAKVSLGKQGVGEGYYSSTRGFLDNNKYIFDGIYYQDYSYEVQSSVPFDKYEQLLKQLLHVSGTKLFGKVVSTTLVDISVTASSNVEITT